MGYVHITIACGHSMYHSKCLDLWYEPTEESRGSLLKPILGA